MRNSWLRVAGAVTLLALVAGVYFSAAQPETAPRIVAAAPDPTAEFLKGHWPDPLPPQGEPPAGFSFLEASLDSESCGQCHPRQFQDWKSSLHAQTMGPGILWQFDVMDQKSANGCMRCHAPLAEQKALLAMERNWAHAPAAPPPGYAPAGLHRQGLVCAACHVRRHARLGPPARRELPRTPDASLPHGGFSASAAFEDSRFCSVCHQFPADGSRLNGKLLENTFEEWRASAAAKAGRSCQSCHMPDRRHLWRGIHDADMVRQALSVSLEVRALEQGGMWAQAELANVGAGHHFPTYLVPEVVAVLQLVDARGTVRAQLERRVIGRKANLELTQEIVDTRIPSGESVRIGGRFRSPGAKGWTVELHVTVHPDKHYELLFRSMLERAHQLPPGAVPTLRKALARIEGGGYELYRLSRPVPPP